MANQRKEVSIIAMGSRGDIQPSLCLATALCALPDDDAVHVTLIVPENYYAWVTSSLTSSNCSILMLPSNAEDAINRQSVADMVVRGDPTVLLRAMSDPEQMNHDLQSLIKWCKDSDLVIVSAMSVPAGVILAEAFGTNVIQMPMFPTWYEITGEFPPMIGLPSLGRFLNTLLYYIAGVVLWLIFKPTFDRMRQSVGLRPITYWGVTHLATFIPAHHTWSPTLHSKPKDWLEETNIGGYLFYDAPTDSLKPELEVFLNDGTPPVYIGFGSMPIHLSTKFVPLIKDVLETLPESMRIVVYAGGMSNAIDSDSTKGQLKEQLMAQDPTGKRLFVTYSVPQRLLFPRCSVIVHHGGSGTTGEALRSGKPSIVCSLIGDQHFWARRVSAIGCGPRIGCSFKNMTGKHLGLKVLEAMKEKYLVRAKVVGKQVGEERGLENAVDYVLRHLREPARTRRKSVQAVGWTRFFAPAKKEE
ncbi:hypothetical protein BDR26DRAFT_851088 [Obelidium mucronatum]|nr:hypothetical protein BDR26DRAFT_851088 [Obelidium mucronatum]